MSPGLRAGATVLVIDEETRVPVTSAMVLGRNPGTETGVTVVAVPDLGRELSKAHVGVTQGDDGVVRITDLASTNGTFINGEPLTPHTPRVLEAGEVVFVGGHHFRVEPRTRVESAEVRS